MERTRRDFLKTSAATAAALGIAAGAQAHARGTRRVDDAPERKLDLLILGGTGFIGPKMVEAALARGHSMTLFNRGRTRPTLFSELEQIKGNRDPKIDEGLEPLRGREFDAVIDTSAYVPRIAEASAEILFDTAPYYLFISTVSVYASFEEGGIDEDSPVGRIEDETVEVVDGRTYGPLKVLCEQAVQARYGDSCSIVRPGLIVGPGDPTDRFTYWPVRVQRGGEVAVSGTPDDLLQYIDVRDLAEWTIRLIEQRTSGTMNAVGPKEPFSMAELLYGTKAVCGGDASFVWFDPEFMAEQGLAAWTDFPMWTGQPGMGTVSRARAIEAGLTYRTCAETVGATLEWWNAQPEARRAQMRAGLSAEREKAALEAWHAR